MSKELSKILIIILCFMVFILLLIFVYIFTPIIKLNGSKLVILEYGDTYRESGAVGKLLHYDISNDIKIIGSVDTNKVGIYKIKYSFKNFIFSSQKIRTVKVIDNKKPIIELDGDLLVKLCPNKEYKEIGYKAIDEYDGDITNNVHIIKKEDKIIYSVYDSSNNKTEVIRKLKRIDDQAPTLKLNGSEKYSIILNGSYKELGARAEDNCDGDLTDNIEIVGNVDTTKENTYDIKYKVKDNSNNETIINRQIKVVKKIDPNFGVAKVGTIYLTFDDGPSAATTGKVLDILKEEGVPATFFVTNSGPDSLIRREFEEGHVVAIHSATHDYSKIYKSKSAYFKDLESVRNRIKRVTGITTNIMRFPGGSNNTVSRRFGGYNIMRELTNEVLSDGYKYFDWNVSSEDAGSCIKAKDKPKCVYDNVTKSLSKNRANIVLMHDIKPYTVDALQDIIKFAKEKGYMFEVISEDTKMITFNV